MSQFWAFFLCFGNDCHTVGIFGVFWPCLPFLALVGLFAMFWLCLPCFGHVCLILGCIFQILGLLACLACFGHVCHVFGIIATLLPCLQHFAYNAQWWKRGVRGTFHQYSICPIYAALNHLSYRNGQVQKVVVLFTKLSEKQIAQYLLW